MAFHSQEGLIAVLKNTISIPTDPLIDSQLVKGQTAKSKNEQTVFMAEGKTKGLH